VASWGLELPPLARVFLDAGLKRRRAGQRRRRWLLGGGVGGLAVVAMVSTAAAFAFSKKEQEAIRQQEQIRLAAGDMGLFDLVLEPFDWDAAQQRATPVPVPPSLDWRLHAVDPGDPHAPGRLYGTDDLRRSSRRVEGAALHERVEARSGPTFLEVVGRGDACASSWVYLQRLPGYTDRVSRTPAVLRIPVPTCQAARADTVEIPEGEFYRNVDAPDDSSVTIDEMVPMPAFFIDRTEVTRGAFAVYGGLEALTGDSAARTSYLSLDRPGGDRLPIVGVDSFTAANYCRFMGKELPDLEHWQKALRGGLTVGGAPNPAPKRTTPWVQPSSKHPTNLQGAADGFPNLAPVGSFPDDTSPYGVVDMAGNVSEWSRVTVDSPGMRGLRFVMGADWDTPLEHAGLRNMRPDRFVTFTIGIRCVRP
jgi:formylglycine-generating enzyme required for sulfatase activity